MSVEEPVAPTSAVARETADDFILTSATHNFVSRAARLQGPQQIEMRGRSIVHPEAVIHGDLSWVRIGRYTHVQGGSQIIPPVLPLSGNSKYAPVSVGSYTLIGKDVRSEAAAIGSFCWIGDGAQLGARSILKDGCIVEDGASIPADTVAPPFTRISSSGGRLCWKEMPPSITLELQERSRQYYHDFASSRQKS